MEQLQFYTHTATRLFLRWLAMLGVGLLLSVLGIIIGLALLGSEATPVITAQPLGLIQTLLAHLKQEMWPMLLLSTSVVFLVAYFILAGKVSMSYLIGQLYAHQLAPVIEDKLTRMLTTMIDKKPEWWHSIDNAKSFKAKLAQATQAGDAGTLKDDDGAMHSLQRKALLYALKKAELDEVDFRPSNPQLASDISSRVMTQLATLAEATSLPFWGVVVAHVLLAILALMLDH